MKALVIIPTFNERDNLPLLVPAVLAHEGVHVLIVDDQSPDGTGDVAEALARAHPSRVGVLHRTGPRGLGRSYAEGLTRAIRGDADVIVQMDADLSHDPGELPALIEAAAHEDLAIGSRYQPGGQIRNWPVHRRLLSAGANHYIRLVTRLDVRDCTSGFRCWRREALARVPLDEVTSEGYAFLVEMLYAAVRAGLRVTEVPIVFVERRLGRSKLSFPVLLESMRAPWRLRRHTPGPRPEPHPSHLR